MDQHTIEGKEVTVSCYGEKTARVFVYRDLGEVLSVCSEDDYRRFLRDGVEPVTIGFQRESVVKVHTETA